MRDAAATPALTAHALRDRAEREASAFPPMLIAAERVADAIIQGMHGRRRAGPGEDFWQFRPYSFGDPVQRIDWRKSARRDRILVRENEWAATNTLWLWTSQAEGMAFKSRLATVTKAERAVLLALSLAILATRAGERVAAIGAPFAPGHTQLTLNRLATWYAASDAADRGEQPPAGHLPRFATCLLISDFLQPLDQITAAWRQFASTGTRGHVVQVLDPAEETFPYAGRTEFEEFSGRDKLIFGRAEKFREPYQQRLHAHQQGLRDLCRRLGWSFTVHHTDRAPNHAILSLFQRISLDKPSHQMVAVGR